MTYCDKPIFNRISILFQGFESNFLWADHQFVAMRTMICSDRAFCQVYFVTKVTYKLLYIVVEKFVENIVDLTVMENLQPCILSP